MATRFRRLLFRQRRSPYVSVVTTTATLSAQGVMRHRFTDADMVEMARRYRDGEGPAEIARNLGFSTTSVSAKCLIIARALGLPTVAERAQARSNLVYDEIERRVRAGETNGAIGQALGKSAGSVAKLRHRIGLGVRRQLNVSNAEVAEIDRRLLAGEVATEVARSVGCGLGPIRRRKKAVRDQIPADFPPCRCGRPHNHGGRCRIDPDKLDVARSMYLSGSTIAKVGEAIGYTAEGARTATAGLIAELRAAGVTCPCGKVVAHNGLCIGKAIPRSVQDRHAAMLAEIEPRLRSGVSRNAIAVELGYDPTTVYYLAKPLFAAWARDGIRCDCGRPIDHGGVCSARYSPRQRGKGASANHVRYGSAALALSPYDRSRARKMLIKGRADHYVAARLAVEIDKIASLAADVTASGVELPGCRCGKDRNHSGACAVRDTRSTPDRRRRPGDRLDRETRRRIMELYKKASSARAISRLTGVSLTVVNRLVNHWRSTTRYALPPCACGRPARHPGGCSKNTPFALNGRWVARIGDMILDRKTPAAIAKTLDISIGTVLKHALPARDRLFAAGHSCRCGRPIGHPYWCSEKWDQHQMPRGGRPLPPQIEQVATDLLVRGEAVASIATQVRVGSTRIWRLRQNLSVEQRIAREKAIRTRAALGGRRAGEAIMRRVNAAVPRGLVVKTGAAADASLRDEVVAEIYLAVIEGRVELEQIEAVVRSFVSQGRTKWQSSFGLLSLDAPASPQGTRNRIDLIADGTAVDQMEEMGLGR